MKIYTPPSRIANLDPLSKLCFALTPLIITLTINRPTISFLTILLISAYILKFSALRPVEYLKMCLIPSGFLVLTSLSLLFSHTHEIALNVLLRGIVGMCCLFFLILSTPLHDILELMRRCRIPDILVSLTELCYTYIFILVDEAETIKQAQTSRLGYTSTPQALRSIGQLLSHLFLRTLLRHVQLEQALVSRGFNGSLRRYKTKYDGNFYAHAIFVSALLVIASCFELVH